MRCPCKLACAKVPLVKGLAVFSAVFCEDPLCNVRPFNGQLFLVWPLLLNSNSLGFVGHLISFLPFCFALRRNGIEGFRSWHLWPVNFYGDGSLGESGGHPKQYRSILHGESGGRVTFLPLLGADLPPPHPPARPLPVEFAPSTLLCIFDPFKRA